MQNGSVTTTVCVARRATVVACLTCPSCETDAGAGAGGTGAAGGRETYLVPVAARFSCRVVYAAAACLACVACGMAAGTGAGGAGVAHGRGGRPGCGCGQHCLPTDENHGLVG
jgi:hypothetical protein